MSSKFISQQDRILVSAIELISESGLNGLTLDGLARKCGVEENVVYKYYGGINEVLVAVVEFFVKFDRSIMGTVEHQEGSTVEKINYFFDAYATYYGNYKEIAAIILHYEELLHNSSTRELISQCITERLTFLAGLIKEGQEQGEISRDVSAEELSDVLISIMNGIILNRRVVEHKKSFKQELMGVVEKILDWVSVKS